MKGIRETIVTSRVYHLNVVLLRKQNCALNTIYYDESF